MAYVDPNTVTNPTAGQPLPAAFLDVVRDDLEFLVNPPSVSVFNNTTQNVLDDTLTVLTANSENFDNDSMHSTASNTSRITINTAGRYVFGATVQFDPSVTGHRLLEFYKNATTRYVISTVPSVSTVNLVISGTAAVVMAVNGVPCGCGRRPPPRVP